MRLAVLVALHLRGSAFGNNSCGKSNSQAISYDHRWAPAFFLIVLCASSRLAGKLYSLGGASAKALCL
ncbi:hypothetical protein JI435_307010 [Parastagonospora nodorum SN15]|uniref:Uncharacterized protein n=1 Tax=Phaeosphaeria nodorum (strain SN15 / ATCC MYA-4574 / FGSC 10173) TaxID=321614 RepID=A0A7U2FFT6_PHANO|nr:hypothetical protein JI435_307010 [Parastagonospora nodorum SN15]QRD04469.1 hypothetical protein JI435_307010 [Parastagonospora nodorum SN15]QRD04470.1 hypothetical protein JI435_307010 [Parastagonospora nodorum SN15]